MPVNRFDSQVEKVLKTTFTTLYSAFETSYVTPKGQRQVYVLCSLLAEYGGSVREVALSMHAQHSTSVTNHT